MFRFLVFLEFRFLWSRASGFLGSSTFRGIQVSKGLGFLRSRVFRF